MHERIVAVEYLSLRRGHIHAFLHLLKQQSILLFRRSTVGDIAYDVNDSFLRTSLFTVGRGRHYRKPAKTGIGPLSKLLVSAHRAVRTSRPIPECMRENGLASVPQHVSRRLPHVLQQNLVGLDDAVVLVMRQNNVVDRIKRIHPLPLRTEHLFQQSEVLHRDGQLLPTALQELQLFWRPANRTRTAQQKEADCRFLSHHRQHHDLPNLLRLQAHRILRSRVVNLHHLRLRLLQHSRHVFGNFRKAGVAQKLRGHTHGMGCDHVPAFQQAEPCCLHPGQPLQLLQRRLNQIPVLLRARDPRGQGLRHSQPPVSGLGFVEHHQQHAQSKHALCCHKNRRRNLVRQRLPGQVQERQTQRQRPRPQLPPAASRTQHGNRRCQQHNPVANLQSHAQRNRIRPQQHARCSESG